MTFSNPDGTLNQDLVERLSRATKARIRREQITVAGDIEAAEAFKSLGDEEYGDFTTRAVDNLLTPTMWQLDQWRRNPFARFGAAVATGGTSEIAFQSATAYEGFRQGEREASELGIDYGLWDAARDGLNTVVDENLPVHTARKLGDIYDKVSSGQGATLWDAAELAGDAVVDVLNVDTLKNLGKSGAALSRGGGWQEIMHSGQGAPSLFKTWETLAQAEARVGGQGIEISFGRTVGDARVPDGTLPETGGDRLWRDPSDVDWQTGGPSLSSRASTVEEKMAEAARGNRVSIAPEVRTRVEAFEAGAESGARKVDAFRRAQEEMGEAMAAGDSARFQTARQEMDRLTVEIQRDKHALNALKNNSDVGIQDSFYAQRATQIEEPAINNATRRLAEEQGVSPDRVRVFKATNSPSPTNTGYDLDVTYQRQLDDGTWVDIDHRVSGRVHNEELWRLTRPGEELPVRIDDQGGMTIDRASMQRNADELDHAVTDGGSHPDAYPGRDLEKITDPTLRGQSLRDVEGVALTAQHKGVERFARGDQLVMEAADQATKEASPEEIKSLIQGSEAERMDGARQLTKQWNKNLGLPRTEAMSAAGNAPGVRVPARLQETMTVLEKIGKPVGDEGYVFTVVDAERTLQTMGMGPRPLDEAAEQLGSFIESVQKLAPPRPPSL